jgi:hypothetical protein
MSAEQHHIVLTHFLNAAAEDPIISPTHIALYLAIHTYWIGQNCVSPIQAPKRDIMDLSKIRSNAIYYRQLKDLNQTFVKAASIPNAAPALQYAFLYASICLLLIPSYFISFLYNIP